MHFLDFFSIVERDLQLLNPSSPEKLMLLAEYCRLKDGAKVLDIGSSKGYLLRSWAKQWAIEGTGLELNPTFVEEARERTRAEGLEPRVSFVLGPALEFQPEPCYDVVTCIGAPFAIGSFDEAVAWMKSALKPEGVLAIGDVFLSAPVPAEILEREKLAGESYRSLAEVEAGLERQGLTLTGLIAASQDDWDRYASGSWRTAHAWAKAHPDHPDRAEVLRLVAEGRERHLRWMREYLGWGVFVAQRR